MNMFKKYQFWIGAIICILGGFIMPPPALKFILASSIAFLGIAIMMMTDDF